MRSHSLIIVRMRSRARTCPRTRIRLAEYVTLSRCRGRLRGRLITVRREFNMRAVGVHTRTRAINQARESARRDATRRTTSGRRRAASARISLSSSLSFSAGINLRRERSLSIAVPRVPLGTRVHQPRTVHGTDPRTVRGGLSLSHGDSYT